MKWQYKDLIKWINNGCNKEIGLKVNMLELYGKGLTSLPSEIGNLTNLQKLDCSSNNLTSLPKEIGNLTNLQILYCFNNKLISLPKEIGNLTNLLELCCYHNKLTSLPSEIGNLTNLKILFCDNNEIEYIQPNIRLILNRNKSISKNVYSDSHDYEIQVTFRKSVNNILNDKLVITDDSLIDLILNDTILTKLTKEQSSYFYLNKNIMII